MRPRNPIKPDHRRLAAYAATAGAVLGVHGDPADAAIVFTDAGGQSIGAFDFTPVDFNNDTDGDVFLFVTTGLYFSVTTIVTEGSTFTTVIDLRQVNTAYAIGTDSNPPTALLANDGVVGNVRIAGGELIDDARFDSQNYAVLGGFTADYLAGSTLTSGEFINHQRGFIGVKFDAAGQGHFGWVDLEVNADATEIILFGYAYESDPDTAIVAGDTGSPSLLLGDANNDGVVTADDLIAVQQNFGNVGPNGDGTDLGDANDDGTVTADDLISVQQNFGNTLVSRASTVPEPGSLAMLAPGAAGVLRWRRLRRAT